MQPEHLERLARCPLFSGLAPGELASAVLDANVVEVAEGERIFAEGDESRRAYVVLDGEVSISTHVLDEQPDSLPLRPVLVKLRAGEVFGEFALLDAEPRSGEATATVASTLCVFDADWLAALSGRRASIAYRVMRNMTVALVTRLRATNQKLRGALEHGWKARGVDGA